MPNKNLLEDYKRQAFLLLRGNRLLDARSLLDEVSRRSRNDIGVWIALVQINAQLGRPDEVERCCREIIRIQPNSHEAHYHLGSALLFQGKRSEASNAFQHALHLKSNHAPTHLQLGHLSTGLGHALEHYRKAVELQPTLADAHAALGAAQISAGQLDEGVSSLRHALHLNPALYQVHSALLFALNYSSAWDRDAVASEHLRWDQLHKIPPAPKPAVTPDPDRRLRIGYCSPDLREHSVSFFFEPLLANHDGENFEIFCYAEVAQPDATTRRLQSISRHWLMTCGMSDEALAERIRADRIDILVDLAGHSANNRLRMFSGKSAPIQINWLGYPNTTGLSAMDYRITDALADPPGEDEHHHAEKLIRLPRGFLCYLPPLDTPAVALPPAASHGYVTFGSYNNLPKMTPETIRLWAKILHAVPDSRLLLKNFSFSDSKTCDAYRRLFAKEGIPSDRISLRGRHDSISDHLASYSDIDIALDTSPYNGTTTTCEALWMGVPVITLAGDRHASRVGRSLLNQLEMSFLIAKSEDDYLRIASKLANDHAETGRLRASLRDRMARSILCDAQGFAHEMEVTYRSLWKTWCAQQFDDCRHT